MIAVGLISVLLALITCVVHLDLLGLFAIRPVPIEQLVANDYNMWIPRPGTETPIPGPPYNQDMPSVTVLPDLRTEHDDFNLYDGCTMADVPETITREPGVSQPNETFDVSDVGQVNSDLPDYEDEEF
ncbi:uncharacterized protein LOC126843343 [Adelges cooleyi]|uniref:uncharacterized protein LOC126843343 n=1 Tax=Adelges cooleyi TaxID=133065 RepID=UPI00217F4916|nr:uncharacterized protein LOC126843343 [Adelges cooleyi]